MGSEKARISVVIPAYQRYEPLVWAVSSVLGQNLDSLNFERSRVVIVNNGAAPGPIDEAVGRAVSKMGVRDWEIRVVHRPRPMEPVFSWYEGIRETTDEGDLVILNGDDDLMLQNSVAMRVKMMTATNADLLLTGSLARLVFRTLREDGTLRASYPGNPAPLPVAAWDPPRTLTTRDLSLLSSAFIGSYVYRNTPLFWKAYQATLDLMSGIPVASDYKYTMLPQFLPLALMDAGKAIASDTFGCLRGGTEEEIAGSRFGKIAWHNVGFYFACCLYVLTQPSLRDRAELDELRDTYLRQTIEWLPLSLRDRQYWQTVRAIGLIRSVAMVKKLPAILRGLSGLAKSILGLNALRFKRTLAQDPGFTFDDVFACY